MNPNKPNMPAPSVEPDELSYYRLTLLSYLRESHPERAADDAFIRARAELAAEAFSNAVRSGMNYDEAVQQADEVLFQGLHFSRRDPRTTGARNEFADEVPAGRAREVALQLLPECGRVFSGYDLSDGFEFTPDFDRLCGELAGVISIWLEENGI